ncbi:unnamed protein product [Cunninghamella blakesleeana]
MSIEDINLETKKLDTSVNQPSTTSNTTTTTTTIENDSSNNNNEETTTTQTIEKEEEKIIEETKREHDVRIQQEAQTQFDDTVRAQRMKRLRFLLEKSGAYAAILSQRLAKQREEAKEKAAKLDAAAIAAAAKEAAATTTNKKEQNEATTKKRTLRKSTMAATTTTTTTTTTTATTTKAINSGKRRKMNDSQYKLTDYLNENDIKKSDDNHESIATVIQNEKQNKDSENLVKPTISARQPKLVTGGVLRDYQLAGVEWLISLWENGLNGILADEMGLGKTLQTISFIAHLKDKKVTGPFLVVTPLSTLANWVNEFKRFTPTISVILYHGTKDQRQHMVNRKMKLKDQTEYSFPIVVTSYEIIMNDRKLLQKYNWKYIVVDEGHRLKNFNCKLIRELKTYKSANRLLLTGTPLQNNLSELWSLLNFLLPDIFNSLEMFESWFNFDDIHEQSGQERIIREEEEDHIISSLHTILKPFLLRRLKTDVEHSLPKKKEYLLYAPLTLSQKQLYDAILKRDVRDYLIKKKANKDDENENIDAQVTSKSLDDTTTMTTTNEVETNENKAKDDETKKDDNDDKKPSTPQLRKTSRTLQSVNYKQTSDRAFFQSLREQDEPPTIISVSENLAAGERYKVDNAIRHVNSLHLQNIVMQLRKVCNHPFLFDWPIDPKTNTAIVNNELAAQSGKVLLLDRLLTELFARGHKVLVFSQMTKMLDILEDWAAVLKGWPVCRLDGSVCQEARRDQIDLFNDPKSPVKLFLLSTRAGGLGINLTGADTVIIFDSDWNPQMDLQAQDRVHRIGQTKPVLVYRFVAANTVEAKILERATAKRRLEKLVISKGKFKTPIPSLSSNNKKEHFNSSELAEILASEDGEQVQIVSQGDKVISDEDLEKLLDRSEHVFECQNTSSSGGFREMAEDEMKDDKNEILATRA